MYRATKKFLLLSGVLYFILLNNFTAGEIAQRAFNRTGLSTFFPFWKLKTAFRSGLAKTNQRQRINRFFFVKSF
jgi:hypothetical protein